MLRIGDTLLIKGHLCVVISDPSKNPFQVVLAVLTTFEDYKDQSCILRSGDHPFIRHETCVDYAMISRTFAMEHLEKLISKGEIKQKDPMPPDVLMRIIRGASQSHQIPNGHWVVLDEQGLTE